MTTDNRTPNRDYPLPHPGNSLSADVLRIIQAMLQIDHDVASAIAAAAGSAGLDSPEFTGTPIAPTPAPADDSNRLATTAFVQQLVDQTAGQVGNIVRLRGEWDASSGVFPGNGTADAGDSWFVSAAGTVDGVEFSVDDRVVAILNNPSVSTYGSNWKKLDYTDRIVSVNGRVGAIVLSKADVGLGQVDNTPDLQKPVSNPMQLALNSKQNAAAILDAVAFLSTSGMIVRTGPAGAAARSIVGTANQIAVTNGSGANGNPTISAIVSTDSEAQAGTSPKLMTAERTAQALAAGAGLAKSLTSPGYITLPGGLIVQWGNTSVQTGNASQDVNLPVAFPNAHLTCIASYARSIGGASNNAGADPLSVTQIRLWNGANGEQTIRWIALGY